MRKVVVSEYVTLDGVMEDPGGAEGFEHGGWSFPFWSEEAAKFKFDELFACDALLLGRVTYQGFAKAWPSMTDEQGFADRMNSLPKFVVSTTLEKLEWNNSRLIKENIAEEVSKLKQQPGEPMAILGSGSIVAPLARAGLIDEYQLVVFPLILGDGVSMFDGVGKTVGLKLKSSRTFRNGIAFLVYEPA